MSVTSAHRFSPRSLFRFFAIAEMYTWAGLIIGLLLRTFTNINVVPITGGIHGFVFLCYGVITILVWINQKWPLGVGVLGLILTVVPFATVPFEHYVDKRGMLAGPWRLTPGGEAPRGFFEHIEAWILRRPVLSPVLLFALVIVVFLVLLWLGPPIPKSA